MSKSDRSGPPWTVLKLLEWSRGYFEEKGIEGARLDAELLLAHVLGLDRVKLYMQYDRPLVAAELDAYRALVRRRAAREPVAYLTGSRGFWTFDLKTDRRALIPRPDTEVLVEEVLKRAPSDDGITLVDVGTGTGAVALAVASERPDDEIYATDVSADALALARENADALGLSHRVTFLEGDLLAALEDGVALDYVVSNPPYIREAVRDELEPEVREWEPGAALFAGEDGLDALRRLVGEAHRRLSPGGWLSVEHGYDQAAEVRALFEAAGFVDVETRRDYGGNDRVTSGRRC